MAEIDLFNQEVCQVSSKADNTTRIQGLTVHKIILKLHNYSPFVVVLPEKCVTNWVSLSQKLVRLWHRLKSINLRVVGICSTELHWGHQVLSK